MAEGDIVFYNNYKEALMNGNAPDLDADTIKVALVAAHTPDIDADDFWDDVSADEVSGAGYTAGGVTLGSKAVTQDNTDDEGVFDAADASWTGLDVGEPSHAICYHDTGTPGTSMLIFHMQIDTPSNGGNYTIQWAAEGIININ
jgi:hypothetical protein